MDIIFRLIYLPFVFLFGAAVGSFLNVVIYRLPARLSLFYPPSRCPHCHHALGKTENVPILGWLWLKGKCRWCRAPISPRYPLIEAMTALLFCGVFWQWGWTTTTFSYWLLVAWLSVLAWIDLDTFILPGILTKWGLILGLGFQGILAWQAGSLPMGLMEGIGSAVLGMWLFEILRWGGTLALGQTAMGGGDPKLAAMIGAWVGWKLLLLSSFLACAVGAVGGGFAIAIGWMSRKQPFPFGPYLAMGTLVAIFWGDRLIDLYLRSFFPVL